jgi:hypothetical protein
VRRGVCFAFGLCLVLCVAFAQSAASGAIGGVISNTACASTDVVGEMAAPEGAFGGAESSEQCEKYCSKAAKQCAGLVKDAASCRLRMAKDEQGWQSRNCDLLHADDPQMRRACKAEAKLELGLMIDAILESRDGQVGNCNEWGSDCAATCVP